jgi:hypothetical protein
MQHDIPPSPVKRLLVIPPALAEAIANFRRSQHILSESEATRRLIVAGLAASQPQEVTK